MSESISEQEVKEELEKAEKEALKADAGEGVVTTEVTSIAEEEKKSGKQMNINAEQLVTAASINMTKTLYQLEKHLKTMKAKRIVEAVIGGLDFPKEGMPVKWVDGNGKPRSGYGEVIHAFMLVQRIISDRFVLTQKHVIDQAQKFKESQKVAEELEKKGKELENSAEENSDSNDESTQDKETTNE